MHSKKLLLAVVPLLTTSAVAQQLPTGWTIGAKAGLAQAWVHPFAEHDSRLAPTLALSIGRPLPFWRSGLYLDAEYEGRGVLLPGYSTASQLAYLTLPLYVRTGLPADRVHLQVGVAYSKLLSRSPQVPSGYEWQLRRDEWAIVGGYEVRVNSSPRLQTTVGLFVHWGVTPTLDILDYLHRQKRNATTVGVTFNGFLTRQPAEEAD